tara:strand:+ start:4865 stop:5500 length:636 start_codon:yes stop_codon:yes gene_type:complete
MSTCYATTADIADFLRINITACTSPSIAQVEKLIKRSEDKIDRRTGHAWRTKTTTEIYNLPLLYTFGWGTFIALKHRNIKYKAGADTCLDTAAGDKIEIWNGSNGQWSDYVCTPGSYDIEYIKGEVYLRGFIFSILRQNRVRVTYRFGDTTVPEDIKDAIVKLTCIDLIRSSIKMDDLEFGGAIKKEEAMSMWKEEVDNIVHDRAEVFVIP